jgi:peroxiredoxin
MGNAGRDRYERVALVLLTALLTGAVATNFWLARTRAKSLEDSVLAVGTAMPSLSGKDLEGRDQAVTTSRERPTVLYVFSPECFWCRRNMANFKARVQQSRARYRFVGLSLTRDPEALRKYIQRSGLDIPVITSLSGERNALHRLRSTPQTIVVSPEGVVLKNWAGAYTGRDAAEVESFFKMKLPGLPATSD